MNDVLAHTAHQKLEPVSRLTRLPQLHTRVAPAAPSGASAASAESSSAAPRDETLVAFRGLWDKFAAPESLDAIRRSYLRGVPSLVHLGSHRIDLQDVMALVANPAVNRRQRAVYLELQRTTNRSGRRRAASTSAPDTPGLPALQTGTPSWLRVFAIAADGGALTRPVFRWNRRAWIRVGVYIPAETLLGGLERAESDVRSAPVVVFESPNVLIDLEDRRLLANVEDHDILQWIRAVAGPHVAIIRVSDLVELDWLDARVREAD